VYVFGMLTDWQLQKPARMEYVPEKGWYHVDLLLKQGFYNYQYVVVPPGASPDFKALEGSFSQTENYYDFFTYFRPVGSRYDRLVGYSFTNYFGRN